MESGGETMLKWCDNLSGFICMYNKYKDNWFKYLSMVNIAGFLLVQFFQITLKRKTNDISCWLFFQANIGNKKVTNPKSEKNYYDCSRE